jgi:hypothetical protein
MLTEHLIFNKNLLNDDHRVNPEQALAFRPGSRRVDPEPRFLTPSLKMGLGAAERVDRI